MVKRKTDENSTIKRKISKKSLNKNKRNNKNRKNNNKYNSNMTDYIDIEKTFSGAYNDFNEKELVKSNTSIEKNENGIVVYTKTDIYKNGKKITKKVFMKDNKILKNTTEIIEDINNSEINNDIIINDSNSIIDNRINSIDDANNNLNNNINDNDNNNRGGIDNSNENNNINIEDIERKINENMNRINVFENKLNDYEGRLNNFKERTMNSISFIERNYVRKRRDFNRVRIWPFDRNRFIARSRNMNRERIRERERRNRYRNRRDRERESFIMSSDYSSSDSNNLGNNESFVEENNFNSDSIPDSILEDVSELNDENKMCLICLEEYKNNDIIKKLPCNHIFHSECLKIWLSQKATCPICRKDLRQNN